MRRLVFVIAGTGAAWLMSAGTCLAGMPSPMFVLTDEARPRVDAISFFLLVILLSALCVKWLWNGLCHDFPKWPRITYRRSLALCLVWGLFFTVVLTMISGARELMTPGAWKRSGSTYQLAEAEGAQPSLESRRRSQLGQLRDALWKYARAHQGQLPPDTTALDDVHVWELPEGMGMRYLYCAGEHTGEPLKIVAFEPGLYDGDRLVLTTDGEITPMSYQALKLALGETRPTPPAQSDQKPADPPKAETPATDAAVENSPESPPTEPAPARPADEAPAAETSPDSPPKESKESSDVE
jgi:hypothetical protein